MKAVIKEREEIAAGTLYVVFDLLGEGVEFKPGQFFFLELIDPPYHDERGGRRHFSFVNSPNEKGVVTMATRMSESAFKRSLAAMPLGSEVVIDNIGGGAFALPEDGRTPLVMVAGGIGITPFISMIRYAAEEGAGNHIDLIYSNKERRSTAFLDELEGRAEDNDLLDLVLTMTDDPSWEGESRRVDGEFITDYARDPASSIFYVAGPPAMSKAMVDELTGIGVDAGRVRVSHFSGY